MAVNVQLKRSAVPGKVPSTTDVKLGELAMNTYDGCIYFKKDGISGQEVVKICGAVANEDTIVVDSFTGDSNTTNFTLTAAPQNDQYAFVTINGVDQQVGSYSLNLNVLTLSEAPSTGDEIEVRTLLFRSESFSLRDYQTFVYQPTTSTTVITGSDVNGRVLAYDLSKIEVYLNGVRLVDTLDYTAANGTSIVLESAIDTGDTLEVVSVAKAAFISWDALKPGGAELSTTDPDQVVDTFVAAHYRTAKYIVSLSHPTQGYHAEEILLMHDDTDVYMTTYAQIFSAASLGTIGAEIVSGTVKLLFSPINTNTTVKLQRITVAA